MHLLYARFFTKALRDMGYLDFSEPFKSLVHQGTILGPDGNRMSKSRGNVVSPDSYISEYGSDAFRMYLMFGFSYIEGGPWNADGIKAVSRFMDRVERIVLKASDNKSKGAYGTAEKELDYVRHNTIDKVTQDMENFSLIPRLRELWNSLTRFINTTTKRAKSIPKCLWTPYPI